LIPLLTDNILVDSDPGTQDARTGANASGLSWPRGIVIPIETKIRILSIRMLYEVCRVQKLSYDDLSKPSLGSSRPKRSRIWQRFSKTLL
jgi:hypothetical protein